MSQQGRKQGSKRAVLVAKVAPPAKAGPAAKAGAEQDGRVLRARRLRATRRSAILAAARHRFAQRGYHRTSIDDIIAEAGIARGTFYLHFESKRAIFDELVAELLATLQATLWRIDVSPGATPPIEQLATMVARVLDALVDNREMASLLLRESVGLDEDFDRKLADFYGRIDALLRSALETGQEMGFLRKIRPAVAARAVLGLVKETVQWAIVDAKLAPGAKGRPVVDVPTLAQELIEITLRGLLPR